MRGAASLRHAGRGLAESTLMPYDLGIMTIHNATCFAAFYDQ